MELDERRLKCLIQVWADLNMHLVGSEGWRFERLGYLLLPTVLKFQIKVYRFPAVISSTLSSSGSIANSCTCVTFPNGPGSTP